MKRCLGCMESYGEDFDICPFCGYAEGTEVEEAIHMSPGTLLSDRYIVGKVLGFGGFGVTYIGWDGKLEQKVAIKEYLPSEFSTRMPGQSRVTVFNGDKNEQFYDGLKKFVDEAKRLAKFQNESGIVKVFDSFIENDTAYIIMEYLDGETLTSYMKREGIIPEDKAVEMLMPVMESLQVVHQEGVLHRDIAPDNIFITKSGEIKLIDFGASRYATTSHSRSLTVIIKPGYSPEEQYRSTSDQGPHTDVYALGACLYKMVTGKTPPDAMERRAKFEAQNKDILESPHKINKQISPIRENAILNAMNVRIEDRTPTVLELMNELNSTVAIKRKNGRIKKIDIYGWPWWFKSLVALFVVAFITTATLMATGVVKVDAVFADGVVIPEGMVSVPELEGITSAKATKKVTSAKLNVSIAGSVISDFVEAGKVVMQEPASGMYCTEYSTVSIYISRGNGEVVPPVDGISTVPYIIGSTEAEALMDLGTAGLGTPDITYAYDENIAEGLVVSQSEEFGEQVPEGTVLKLTVSLGSEPFALPDVLMQARGDAERTLKMLGLNVEFVEQESADYANGVVISQSVEAGTMVRKTDLVTLTVVKAIWSEWSTEEPKLADNQIMETKTQYSYSDKSTTTQTDNNYLEGWTLDESLTQTTYADDFGGFSDWSTDAVTASDTRKVEIKQQYRYQDKEYTTSDNSALSGWTQTGSSSSYTDWSGWSEWQDAAVEANDLTQVESKVVYMYYFYACPGCGYHMPFYNTSCSACGTFLSSNFAYTLWDTHPHSQLNYWGNGKYYANINGSMWYGWSDPAGVSPGYKTQYRYQSRTLVYTYNYERWGGWSSWKDSEVTSSATRNVETRTMYRYADKVPHTVYTFYQWSKETPFSDDVVTESATRKVKTRKLYRYMTQ